MLDEAIPYFSDPGPWEFGWEGREGESWETEDVTQMGRLSYCDLAYTGYQTTFAIKTKRRSAYLDWQRVDNDPAYQPPL